MKKLFLAACLLSQLVACDNPVKKETETRTQTIVKEKHFVHIVTEEEALILKEDSENLKEIIDTTEKNLDENLKTVGDIRTYRAAVKRLQQNMEKLEKFVKGLTGKDSEFLAEHEFNIGDFMTSKQLTAKYNSLPMFVSEDFASSFDTYRDQKMGYGSLADTISDIVEDIKTQYVVDKDVLAEYKQKFQDALAQKDEFVSTCNKYFDQLNGATTYYIVDTNTYELSDLPNESKAFKLRPDEMKTFKSEVLEEFRTCIPSDKLPIRDSWTSTSEYDEISGEFVEISFEGIEKHISLLKVAFQTKVKELAARI